MVIASGTDTLAQELFTALSSDITVSLPTIPNMDGADFNYPPVAGNVLYNAVGKINNTDLTEKTVDGNGTFDILMTAIKVHLKDEYEQGRITGNDYVKAYIEMTLGAMGNAVQFLLGREQSYWQALLTQMQARAAETGVVTARIEMETAKATLVQQAAQAEAQIKLGLAQYTATKLSLSVSNKDFEIKDAQERQAEYQLSNTMPSQKKLIDEQMEAARAQTLDSRSDAAAVKGTVGKQKELYTQQITSYQQDSRYKGAKMWLDAYITHKTLDEGLTVPAELTNAKIDTVLSSMRVDLGLT